ncbi:MAG: hypothetical protein HN509_03440, partial [Halobacteriovoraceae bacterium]|nr:hypothetical protein [Halobacteriovoraceae bacterium]
MIRKLGKPFLGTWPLAFAVAILMSACVPSAGQKVKEAECPGGFEFDAVARKCFATGQVDGPPIPTLSSVSVAEDSGNTQIELLYSDDDGAQVTACAIVSSSAILLPVSCACTGGVCLASTTPIVNLNGVADFTYNLTDSDGTSINKLVQVQVTGVNDVPLLSSASTTLIEDSPEVTLNIRNFGPAPDQAPTIDDSADGMASSTVTFEIVGTPLFGSATTSISSGGFLTYSPSANFDGYDQITYRIRDTDPDTGSAGLYSLPATIFIRISPTFDDPALIPSTTYATTTIEDAIVDDPFPTVILPYSDPEGDLATNCFITNSTGVFAFADCVCAAGVCSTNLRGEQDFFGASTLNYIVRTNSLNSATGTMTFNFTGKNDAPFAYSVATTTFATSSEVIDENPFGNISFDESPDSTAATVTFSLPAAVDPEGDAVTYTLTTVPTGRIKGCLGFDTNGNSNSGFKNTISNCVYEPVDGNAALLGGTSTLVVGDIVWSARTTGTFGDSVTIEYVHDPSMKFRNIAIASASGTAVRIRVSNGSTTPAQIEAALLLSSEALSLVVASTTGTTAAVAPFGPTAMAGGTNGIDFFEYVAVDAFGATSTTAHVDINIRPVGDKPVVCQFSGFSEANECGLNGCAAATTPFGAVVPTSHTTAKPITFYNSSTSVCWKSTGTATTTDWIAVDSHIADHVSMEKETIIINSLRIDEGGGDAAEDAETLTLLGASSSNDILVPTGNIQLFRGSAFLGSSTSAITLGDGAFNSGDMDYEIRVIPQGGQFGSSTITLHFQDTALSIQSVPFTVTVLPVSAIHGGWQNINAQGPKVDKFGQSSGSPFVCNFSRTKCGAGLPCTGTVNPNGSVVPDETNALFYDSAANKCYYAGLGGDSGSWVAFTSKCNISASDLHQECSSVGLGASCIGTQTPTAIMTTSTRPNTFYYDRLLDECWRTMGTGSTPKWQQYSATAETIIDWNTFTVSSPNPPVDASIEGWNVFRRVSSVAGFTSTFDYTEPVNKVVIDKNTTTYSDNSTNSWLAPVPNTAYLYEVKPVIKYNPTGDELSTDTNDVFKTIRLIAPGNNQTFIHRWIVNKEMCGLMNRTPITAQDFACLYEGPGSTFSAPAAGINLFDITQDLIVDTFEASCPYSPSPDCTGTDDGSCLGLLDPNGNVTAGIANGIYYNRSDGKCYVSDVAGTTWTEMELSGASTTAAIINDMRTPRQPPMVHVSQVGAMRLCNQATSTEVLGMSLSATSTLALPTKKYQRAYSLWDDDTLSESSITTTETGLSLNSTSKCNSSSASGISDNYADVGIPDSNTFYSLPGTATSNIRSVISGSDITASCVSRFKVQDTVGNVGEWTGSRVNCPTLSSCQGLIETDLLALPNSGFDFQVGDRSDSYDRFRLGNFGGFEYGPCVDTDSDDVCDGALSTWIIEDENFDANAMSIPLGLPARNDF